MVTEMWYVVQIVLHQSRTYNLYSINYMNKIDLFSYLNVNCEYILRDMNIFVI